MSTVTDNLKKKYTELSIFNSGEASKLAEISAALTLASITPTVTAFPTGSAVDSAATGNASSSVFDWGNDGPEGFNVRNDNVLVRIVTTIGATPTCTFAIQGSTDNSTFAALTYADYTAPTTFAATTFVTTTATTKVKLIKPGQIWRYLKVVRTSNTNVTVTTDVYPLGGDLSGVAVA